MRKIKSGPWANKLLVKEGFYGTKSYIEKVLWMRPYAEKYNAYSQMVPNPEWEMKNCSSDYPLSDYRGMKHEITPNKFLGISVPNPSYDYRVEQIGPAKFSFGSSNQIEAYVSGNTGIIYRGGISGTTCMQSIRDAAPPYVFASKMNRMILDKDGIMEMVEFFNGGTAKIFNINVEFAGEYVFFEILATKLGSSRPYNPNFSCWVGFNIVRRFSTYTTRENTTPYSMIIDCEFDALSPRWLQYLLPSYSGTSVIGSFMNPNTPKRPYVVGKMNNSAIYTKSDWVAYFPTLSKTKAVEYEPVYKLKSGAIKKSLAFESDNYLHCIGRIIPTFGPGMMLNGIFRPTGSTIDSSVSTMVRSTCNDAKAIELHDQVERNVLELYGNHMEYMLKTVTRSDIKKPRSDDSNAIYMAISSIADKALALPLSYWHWKKTDEGRYVTEIKQSDFNKSVDYLTSAITDVIKMKEEALNSLIDKN